VAWSSRNDSKDRSVRRVGCSREAFSFSTDPRRPPASGDEIFHARHALDLAHLAIVATSNFGCDGPLIEIAAILKLVPGESSRV
jgi:hypothetical protein